MSPLIDIWGPSHILSFLQSSRNLLLRVCVPLRDVVRVYPKKRILSVGECLSKALHLLPLGDCIPHSISQTHPFRVYVRITNTAGLPERQQTTSAEVKCGGNLDLINFCLDLSDATCICLCIIIAICYYYYYYTLISYLGINNTKIYVRGHGRGRRFVWVKSGWW